LHRAVWRDDKKVVEYLLKDLGAEINLQMDRGHTPLMWAAKRNHRDMFIYLLERGADHTLLNAE
jgi:ankyrin repeat protein